MLAASSAPVNLLLGLKPPITLRVTQDGQPLDGLTAGEDSVLAGGQSTLPVDPPRMYQIVRNPDARHHELRLEVPARAAAVYAFSLSSCVKPAAST